MAELIYTSDRLYSRGAKLSGICVLVPFHHPSFPQYSIPRRKGHENYFWVNKGSFPNIEKWATETLIDDAVVCLSTEDVIIQASDGTLRPPLKLSSAGYSIDGDPWYVFRFMNNADAVAFKLTWL